MRHPDPDAPRPADLLAGARALLFDLDGTLLDSGPSMAPAVNAVRAHLGLGPLPTAAVVAALGGGLGEMLGGTLPVEHHPGIDGFRSIFHEVHRRHLLDARPFPGVDPLVRRLGPHIGLVTNAPRRYVGPLLEHFGWSFAVICDGDGPRKPDPTPLRIAAARLGIPPSAALFVGDSAYDRDAAAAAGMPFATVPWSRLDGPRIGFEALARWEPPCTAA